MASEQWFKDVPPFPSDVPTINIHSISLAELRKKDPKTISDLRDASRQLGFFLLDLRNDVLGEVMIQEIDKVWAFMKELMNLPNSIKARYLHEPPDRLLGFKPLGAYKVGDNQPDRYEWFNISQDELLGNVPMMPIPDLLFQHRKDLTSYLMHGHNIASILCESLAEQLGLPPSIFNALQAPTRTSGSVVRFIKSYASLTQSDLRTSMLHHTDLGTITLLTNVLGGLQVLTPGKATTDDDAWFYVPPQPNCLVVNLGDAMVEWTDGILRSNIHRVFHAPGEQRSVDRYSMAIFVRPQKEASMRSLMRAKTSGENDESDITAWEWENKKARAFMKGK